MNSILMLIITVILFFIVLNFLSTLDCYTQILEQ
jgi:hypothetical protein